LPEYANVVHLFSDNITNPVFAGTGRNKSLQTCVEDDGILLLLDSAFKNIFYALFAGQLLSSTFAIF